MVYDLPLIQSLCLRLGLSKVSLGENTLNVELAPSITLCVVNSKTPDDSLIGFLGTPWHNHGDFSFSRRDGHYLDSPYAEVIMGLGDGTILISERWVGGKLQDRWLSHRDYLDDFRYMEYSEEMRIIRIACEPR